MVLKKIDPSNLSNRSSLDSPGPDGLWSTVLYVEDEDSNWNVTELHLRNKYKLFRAKTAQETFSFLTQKRVDLILLDIQLADSEYDGIEICRILKRHPFQEIPTEAKSIFCQNTPIVFVTAYAERHTKEALLKAGADDVITKPVDFTRMLLVSSRLIVRKIQSTNTPPFPGK